MSDVDSTIYRVDPVVQAYAKTTGRKFADLAKRYNAIIKSKRFAAAFPKFGTVALVQSTGGGSYAYVSGGHSEGRVIALGSNLSESTLLHEIAHHVAYRHRDRYGVERGHGAGFALALLDVVRVCQGAEAERALRHMYRALNIRVFKAGTKRGGFARTVGEAPERARDIIASVVDSKTKHAQERGIARAMVRARGERVERSPRGGYYARDTYRTVCPLCGGAGLVTESRRMTSGSRWWAACDPCGVNEMVTVAHEPVVIAAR